MELINKLRTEWQLLTEVQAAERLNLSIRTLQAWRVKGTGPRWHRLGRSIRYDPEDLDEWLTSTSRRSTSDVAGG